MTEQSRWVPTTVHAGPGLLVNIEEQFLSSCQGYLYAASHHPIKGRVVLTFSPSMVFLDHCKALLWHARKVT